MIVRVSIVRRGGRVIRNWALHKCPDNIKIGELGKSLVDGSSYRHEREYQIVAIVKINLGNGEYLIVCSLYIL